MKKYLRALALILAVLFMLAACGEVTKEATDASDTQTLDTSSEDASEDEAKNDDEKQDEKADGAFKIEDDRFGTAVNIDTDAIGYMYNVYGDSVVNDLRSKAEKWYDDRYADCGISDILYNVPDIEAGAEKYLRKTETLEDGTVANVDYSTNTGLRAQYLVHTQADVDPYQVWFAQCRKDGINPWLSFRMNDVHYADEKTGHSEFFYEAKKNGWMIGNARGGYWWDNTCTQGSRNWHPYAFDYTYAQVRDHFLGIIDKQMDMYDAYGIELDWQRTIWCFPTDTLDNVQYMDMFMKDLSAIVSKYEQKYGHEIKVSARIGRDIEENKYFGFDVVNWAKEDWIDVIIPASYWGATDTDMPITEWKAALESYDVDVWAGLECHVMNNSQWQTVNSLAAQTAQYLSQGADKIYLYNLFNDTKDKFKACSSLENAYAVAKRSYIVTRSNCTPYTTQHKEYRPLPIKAEVNELTKPIVIDHGLLNYSQDTLIFVAVSGVALNDIDADTMTVKYNGVECSFRGTSAKSFLGTGTSMGTVISYAIPKDAITAQTLTGSIVFDVGMNLTVNYIEIMNGNSRI